MSELLTPALAGTVAGLGVAMPMGAMSVLLLQQAMGYRRAAVAAAAGIATVDLGYATLATTLGPWVASHVTPVEAWLRLTSAAVLLTLATHGLTRATASRTAPAPAPAAPAHPAPPAFEARGLGRSPGFGNGPASEHGPGPGPRRPGPAKTFARYVGLTAVNPTTALYFAALTTAQATTLRTPPTAAAFLAGVALASLLWQLTLVALGAFAADKISPAARIWTFRLGHGLVAAYALKIAFPLP
ncbi:LysE family transporter [Streptomyces sp. ISL-87]|uniref:LysE family transporter n=1 Tax=Streptomyces sp. ISL-87 TaxID=2819188 RepID=UPI001BE65EC5|nr:LysE family transporter [Streptomyces sp. ISL-87]MBT2610045.1 LysE family transporter [Streptomyces sp. ISL-87]